LPLVKAENMETLLAHWLEHEVHRNAGYSTWKTYGGCVKHIVPTLGKVQAERLTPEQVDRPLTAKEEEGLAVSHIQLIHKVRRLALAYAMRYGKVSRNVAALVRYRPRALRREQEVRSFTIEQARAFAETIKHPLYKAPLITALNTGMREGEVMGLTLDNILWDEDPMQIRVMWQLARRENPTWQLDRPKTKRSGRNVAINPLVYDILCRRREMAVLMTVPVPIWGSERRVDNLVFTNPKGRPINPETLRNHFKAALVAGGLPLDFLHIHDLRHTFTSLCLDNGVPLEVLSDVLGHSSIGQTKDNLWSSRPQDPEPSARCNPYGAEWQARTYGRGNARER
jgi:integrase